MKRGFLRQMPFVTEARLGQVRLADPADPCEGLGLLARYQCEINQLKSKLNVPVPQPGTPGAPVYVPPSNPLPVPPGPYSECPPGYTRSQSPPYGCLKDVEDIPSAYRPGRRPVSTGFTPEGPNVPISVTSGGNTRGLPPPPPLMPPLTVPARAQEPCPPGYTRNLAPPYDCRKNQPSTDRDQGFQYPAGGDIRVPSRSLPWATAWGGGGGGFSAPNLTGRAGFLGQVRLSGADPAY